MDNDVTASSTTRNRQGRRRRNLLIGLGAAAVVGIAVVVGATLQNFTAGTSGALGARACPGINVTILLPSIAPVPEVDWSNCNLVTARLSGAYLSMANLNGASLQGADLTGATLAYANLSGANLTGANLSGANLTGANLSGAIGVFLTNTTCPNGTSSNQFPNCTRQGGGL